MLTFDGQAHASDKVPVCMKARSPRVACERRCSDRIDRPSRRTAKSRARREIRAGCPYDICPTTSDATDSTSQQAVSSYTVCIMLARLHGRGLIAADPSMDGAGCAVGNVHAVRISSAVHSLGPSTAHGALVMSCIATRFIRVEVGQPGGRTPGQVVELQPLKGASIAWRRYFRFSVLRSFGKSPFPTAMPQ